MFEPVPKIQKFSHPLFCWDVISMQTVNESIAAQKQIDIKKIVQNLESRRCKLDLELINTKSCKAIVLTDPSQFIIWVNSGFAQMTVSLRPTPYCRKSDFYLGRYSSQLDGRSW